MTAAEIDFIAACESSCFAHPWTSDEVAAVFDGGYGVCAVSPGIGYALGRVSFDEAELYRIAVLPEKRRMHAGSELLARFIDLCRARGVLKIFLEVRSRNTPAVRLYEKAGFVLISTRRNYYGDDDALVYLLEIGE